LSDRLVERFASREKNDINRISQVVLLINHTGCQTSFLLNYFGEHRDQSCGHCEFCLTTTGEEDRPARVAINTVRPAVHWETWKATGPFLLWNPFAAEYQGRTAASCLFWPAG
jgi:hypothetical protein